MNTKLTHAITIMQAGIEATFKITDKEYKMMPKKYEPYNFAWFAWADYTLSRSKRGRFNEIFDYHRGNFYLVSDAALA